MFKRLRVQPPRVGTEENRTTKQKLPYILCIYIPQTKTARQGGDSYLLSIVGPLYFRIVGCQVPRPRCLSLAAYSLVA